MKIKLKKAYHMDTFANKMSALVINSTPRSMATADKVKLYNNIRAECGGFAGNVATWSAWPLSPQCDRNMDLRKSV